MKGGLSLKRGVRGLVTLLLLFLMEAMSPSAEAYGTERGHAALIDQAQHLRLVASSIGYHALLSSYGHPYELRWLSESRDAFDESLRDLMRGIEKNRAEPGILRASVSLRSVEHRWTSVRKEIDEVLNNQSLLLALPGQIQKIRESADRLVAVSDEIVEIGAGAGIQADLLYLAGRQSMLSQRIAKNIILFGRALDTDRGRSEDYGVLLAQFGKDVRLFKEALARLRERMPRAALSKLGESGAIFDEISTPANSILRNAPALFKAQLSAQLVLDQFGPLADEVGKLEKSIRDADRATRSPNERRLQ